MGGNRNYDLISPYLWPPPYQDRRSWRVLLLSAIILMGMAGTRAAPFSSFGIDPAKSTVRLHGSVVAFGLNWNLNYQEIGSLDASCEGVLLIERSESSVEILQGKVTFHDSGSWEPDFFGAPGRAPANYGVRSGGDVGGLRIIGLTALRDCAISLGRTNLSMTSQAFPARRIPLQFVGSSVVD